MLALLSRLAGGLHAPYPHHGPARCMISQHLLHCATPHCPFCRECIQSITVATTDETFEKSTTFESIKAAALLAPSSRHLELTAGGSRLRLRVRCCACGAGRSARRVARHAAGVRAASGAVLRARGAGRARSRASLRRRPLQRAGRRVCVPRRARGPLPVPLRGTFARRAIGLLSCASRCAAALARAGGGGRRQRRPGRGQRKVLHPAVQGAWPPRARRCAARRVRAPA